MSRWFAFLLAAALVAGAAADTPANCTSEDVVGKWTLWRSMRAVKPGTDCAQDPVWAGLPWLHSVYVDLLLPNKAVDEFGNEGSWTMVHNQGVHIDVNGRTYFGYFAYSKDGRKITSYCQMVGRGLSHDVNMRHWACFYGQKSGYAHSKTHDDVLQPHGPLEGHLTKEDHQRVVAAVNARTQLWKAELHEPFSTLSAEDLLRVRGGRNSWTGPRPRAAPATPEQLRAAELLPPAFDWRDVNGVGYVSPVRDQGSCGSSYAFSSVGMMEARLRIRVNNTRTLSLSPQDVVSCSGLSQGCDGGIPFLIGGRYAQDYGMVPEQFAPYTGRDSACPRELCDRVYAASYEYIGGYYGACNEAAMKLALVRRGPLSVSLKVHPDFIHYKTGVYHRVTLDSDLELTPDLEVHHAVLLVGYGVDAQSGEKYWAVKNSWGRDWGEDGFFRIRRGQDEVGIESLGMEAEPIPF
ncbi:dipeptidyl peptidase 1-like [Thrips palmi]|uniref:Dipeptidyl peptidase 1-like n=1 Tax=Thrips palmi TaxID=161013 RepID=A0A6P8ZRK7_THRPL|nr:dipeptidyl peptidase 1-like [Thrips palmi]